MRLFAKVVTLEGGYKINEEEIRNSGYKIGDMFKVSDVSMGQSITYVYDAKDGRSYNSIYFEFYDENGVEIDIYNNNLFNPYM